MTPAELAKKAVEEYVSSRVILELPPKIPKIFQRKAGVFICIKKKGELRGCIGTVEPCFENIYEEIIQNSISSATRDPRFAPVSFEELSDLAYTVDILMPPEIVRDINDLDPKKYGIIIKAGPKRGLLLPDLTGINTPEEQISIALRKAGIALSSIEEPINIFRFLVERHC